MFGFILGVLITSLLFWLAGYVRRQRIKIHWWGWVLMVLWLLFLLFTVSMAYTLMAESAGKAALVVLLIFGVTAVVTGVLLARFVFAQGRRSAD